MVNFFVPEFANRGDKVILEVRVSIFETTSSEAQKICYGQTARQTDGQNNVQTSCAYVTGIFTKKFSSLSSIAAKKIIFPKQRYGVIDRHTD